MIRKVELENFKSHKDTKLDFSNLTVLCGANASGKSSVIQALLLLRESFSGGEMGVFNYLNLQTNSVKIGTAKDALYQYSEKNEISFRLSGDSYDDRWCFKINDSTKTVIPKLQHNFNGNGIMLEPSCKLFFSPHFISAARFGPQSFYPKDDLIDILNQISEKEGKAEYAVQFLDKNRNQDVVPKLCISSYDNDLFTQVTAWEREITFGVNVVVVDNGQLGYELKYQFNTDTGKTDLFNAINVGFGLTYALPIIVAILSAKPNESILFIENPEAHLHPKGQAKLAELICLAAQAGVQIVIETHSDHIFNGIRKNIASGKIEKDNVKIHYFEMGDNSATISTEIKISDIGRILNHKKGLFDQFDDDLDELLGL
ncbi:hypothetical protein AGMMS49965_01240 [Bacteroidia bacterium]|nr:hypothetical protein AGMMS49965_01240 [Bacteroidia bacterium]